MSSERPVEILEGIRRRWIVERDGTLAFLNLIGIGYDLLTGHNTTIAAIVICNCIGAAYLIMRYAGHVRRVEINGETITIHRSFGVYSDRCENYRIVEKVKWTRTLRRYRVLTIVNAVTGKKYKIASDEWKDYERLRKVLGERIGWTNG